MKKHKIVTRRAENPNRRLGPALQFKVNPEERRIIEERAAQLAGGNLSAYLRHAALNFKWEEK